MTAPHNEEARTTAPTVPGLKDQNAQSDCPAKPAFEKVFDTLRARAALAGLALHLIDDGEGGGAFFIHRWNLSRTLADVEAVETFLARAGARHG